MVDKLIPPRRDELVTDSGKMTRRFADYLERNADQTNDLNENSGADEGNIDSSTALISVLQKRLDNIESQLEISFNPSSIFKKLDEIENSIETFDYSLLKSIQLKIDDIQAVLDINNTDLLNTLSRRISDIENSINVFNSNAIDDLQRQINEIKSEL